jgi:hypothetical protein
MRGMPKVVAIPAMIAVATILGGCVYDPYARALVPCCDYYGDPYAYRYPPPNYASAYPPGRVGTQLGGAYGAAPLAGNVAASPPQQPGPLELHFAAANVTNDGRLTREQAETGMPLVARNFSAIDAEGKGFVTLPEIQAFLAQRRVAGEPPEQFDAN